MSNSSMVVAKGLVVVRGHAINVSSRILVEGMGAPSALTETRFEIDGAPAVSRIAHDYMNLSEADDVIVAGYFKGRELWVDYWWNCTIGKGRVPRVRSLWPSVISSILILAALVGLFIWQPALINSPASALGAIALVFSLSVVYLRRRDQKASSLINAAKAT